MPFIIIPEGFRYKGLETSNILIIGESDEARIVLTGFQITQLLPWSTWQTPGSQFIVWGCVGNSGVGN